MQFAHCFIFYVEYKTNHHQNIFLFYIKKQRGRIHGNPVADGWAGAVMQKPLAIQNC